ncbi:MAG TPA: PIN domain-containing protein [Gemmatimonadales bacterium]
MIATDRLILLDTNVLLYLIRGGPAGDWIDREFGLRRRAERPLIAVTSVGELLRIAARGRQPWGLRKRQQLEELVSELVVVPHDGDVLERYGTLGAFLDDCGKPIPQNDMWIAAAAAARDAVLLTTDTDFDALHEADLVERVFIDRDRLPKRSAA